MAAILDKLPTINLPPLVIGHSLFLSFMGLKTIFSPPKTTATKQTDGTIKTTTASDEGTKGILLLAIGMSYLCTSYVPMEQNAFLHASIPVRLALAALAVTRMLFVPGLSKAGRSDMLIVLLIDGVGAMAVGWNIGNFTGRLPS